MLEKAGEIRSDVTPATVLFPIEDLLKRPGSEPGMHKGNKKADLLLPLKKIGMLRF